MGVLQKDLALLSDVSKHSYYLETIIQKRISQHEKAVLMIDQVFAMNRVRSHRFLGEIDLIIKDKRE